MLILTTFGLDGYVYDSLRAGASEATAKTHVARILQKLGVRDRVQAVIFAYESGLVRPGSAS